MSRPRAGYVGFNRVPAASAFNSAASGVWTVREAEAMKRAGTWPAGSVSPTQIAGLQLWLDGSDAATLYDATTGGSLVAADGAVARWEDKSGNGRHATQSTSGSRPTRKTAIQNSLGVVRFDGSNDAMSISGSTATFKFLHGTTATLLYVAKYGTSSDPNAQYGLVSTGAASGNEIGFFHSYDDRAPSVNNSISSSAIRDASGNRAWLNRVNDTVTPNTFIACSEVIDAGAATAANRSTVRINGGSAIQGNSLTNSPSGNDSQFDLTIGVIVSSSPLAHMAGDIAEIIIYNSALSNTDRAAVESYLIAKWGVA
jgi:hypothetical protein